MAYNSTAQEWPTLMLPWHHFPPTTTASPLQWEMWALCVNIEAWSFVMLMAGIEQCDRGRGKEMHGLDVGAHDRIHRLIVHYWRSQFVSPQRMVELLKTVQVSVYAAHTSSETLVPQSLMHQHPWIVQYVPPPKHLSPRSPSNTQWALKCRKIALCKGFRTNIKS